MAVHEIEAVASKGRRSLGCIVLLAVVLTLTSLVSAQPAGPLPADLTVEAPGPDVPPELAKFAGVWGNGAWDGVLAHVLVVEQGHGREVVEGRVPAPGVVPAFNEVDARVRALLRRADGRRLPGLRLDDLALDPALRRVIRGERRIELTAREYALLEYFLRNIGRVLSRPMIAQHVWGVDFDSESNTIDVYVGYLRRKIERDGERRLLHTVCGAGYVMKVDE
jgi:hypothetical protein